MKKLLFLCASLMALVSLNAQEKPERVAFSNLGISLNASTMGIGFTLSTPLANHFALRAGYQFSNLSATYTYDDFDPVIVYGQSVEVPDLDLKGTMHLGSGHVAVDYIPFKQGKGVFFVAAGLFFGQKDFITLDGQLDMSDPAIQQIKDAGLLNDIKLELGDDMIYAKSDGHMKASLGVNGVRPYIGLGVGRAIPKHRFGFRVELGAIFHGKPEIISENIVSNGGSGSISEFSNTISNFIFYPQLSFQLTYKLFKD